MTTKLQNLEKDLKSLPIYDWGEQFLSDDTLFQNIDGDHGEKDTWLNTWPSPKVARRLGWVWLKKDFAGYKEGSCHYIGTYEQRNAFSKCLKRRAVVWKKNNGERLYTKTSCKSWRCRACRPKKIFQFVNQMTYGISMLRNSYFITTTLRKGEEECPRNAEYVRRVQKKFLRKLQQINPERYGEMAWMAVPELTKKGQPHLHWIWGNLNGKIPRDYNTSALSADQKAEHELSKAWDFATDGSYIIDCQPVRSGAGLSAYISKYFVKQNRIEEHALYKLGFHRKFSCSANWPRLNVTKVLKTAEFKPLRVSKRLGRKLLYTDVLKLDLDKEKPMDYDVDGQLEHYEEIDWEKEFVRVGDDTAVEWDERLSKKIAAHNIKKEVQKIDTITI